LEVLIIGAGMSGILAAIKLAEIGVKYKLYEKNDDLGGTWYENWLILKIVFINMILKNIHILKLR